MTMCLRPTRRRPAALGQSSPFASAGGRKGCPSRVLRGFQARGSREAFGRLSKRLEWTRCVGAALLLAVLAASAQGQSVTLAWDPSPSAGVAGYRLYKGGASGAYTKVIDVGNVTSNRVSGLASGATYFFAVTTYDTNNLESDFSNEICYTVPSWSVTFAADSGTISTPLVASDGKIDQPVGTDLAKGGEAAYSFNLPNAGNYVVSAMVLAPNEGQNSFYVNVDAEPIDPLTIWDIPISPTLTSRVRRSGICAA